MASNPNLREGTARAIANRLAGPVAEKYQRPANVEKFMKDSFDYQMGLNAGGTESTDASGITRLNLVNKGVKDDLGRTLLSMTKPYMTAMPPTLGQLAGDFGRAAGDTLGAVGEKVMSGGVTGDLLNFIKDKFEGSKQKLNRVLNPPGEKLNQNLEGILNNLESSNMSGNPLFNNRSFDPIRVSDMDPSTMTADASVLDGILQNYNKIRDFGMDTYSDLGLDRFRFDPFNPDKGVDFKDTFTGPNDTPVDYNFGVDGDGNIRFGFGFQY
jgi:hypothetical protein